MICKAVLSSASNPEYGSVTVSFPLPNSEYDHTIERLEDLGIGDVLKQDCRIVELESPYPVLKRIEDTDVNVDELDYLAKRLDSFDDGEAEQFQATAHMLDLKDIRDFINLTFSCQQATVITDFSDLEKIGTKHRLNLQGGAMTTAEYIQVDGRKEAMNLILNKQGTVTPYGVVYDNGMRLEQVYTGRQFPPYLYDDCPLMLFALPKQGGGPVYFCLPASDRQIERSLLRGGITALEDAILGVEEDGLPLKISNRLQLENEELHDLNGMCRALQRLGPKQREMLEAVVCAVQPDRAREVRRLAEELDQFHIVPDVRTAKEYGRYMIQSSGQFAYDPELADVYDYAKYGEARIKKEGGLFTARGYVAYNGTTPLLELMQDEPAEQELQEQGPQMGGMSL